MVVPLQRIHDHVDTNVVPTKTKPKKIQCATIAIIIKPKNECDAVHTRESERRREQIRERERERAQTMHQHIEYSSVA